LTRRWVLLRALRSGNSWSRTSIRISTSGAQRARVRLQLTGRGALRTAGGGAQFIGGYLVRSARHQARGLRTAARGTGMVSGAYGYVYSEYRRQAS
jgi:hypothetical protein